VIDWSEPFLEGAIVNRADLVVPRISGIQLDIHFILNFLHKWDESAIPIQVHNLQVDTVA